MTNVNESHPTCPTPRPAGHVRRLLAAAAKAAAAGLCVALLSGALARAAEPTEAPAAETTADAADAFFADGGEATADAGDASDAFFDDGAAAEPAESETPEATEAVEAPEAPAPVLPTFVADTGVVPSPAATFGSGTAAVATAAAGDAIIGKGLNAAGGVVLMANKSLVVSTRVPYKRVSIAQPDVADVNLVGPTSILVTAKKPGNTQMVVWDDADRSQIVDVRVGFDVDTLQDHLKEMFPSSQIEAGSINGSIALRGRVPNAEVAERAVAVAKSFSPTVLNFLEISGGQQVMLQVRFAEVSRAATNALGVNFGYADGISSAASNIGQVNPFSTVNGETGTISSSAPVSPNVTLFAQGVMGQTAFRVFVSALRRNNLLRVLAEPNLIAMSGQEASFLAGGEFPIPVPQEAGAGTSTITVEYKQFGVRLNFTPVVMGDGRIRLKVSPEVSDLDFSRAVQLNGFVIPSLTTRQLDTVVELNEGQTFAVAGLLNQRTNATRETTPLLGDLPILGTLFRSVRYERNETELVVLVTPYLVEPMNPDQLPMLPGEHWRHAKENELFLDAYLGGPEAEAHLKPGVGAEGATADGTAADPEANPENATAPAAAAADASPARFRGPYGFQESK